MILGVPVVRRYDLLPRLLESAEIGTVRPDIYVIVDNGNQPGRSLGPSVSRDNRVVVVDRPGRNLGCSGAWNTIVDYARTLAPEDTLVIANDDVVLASGTLQRVTDEATRNPVVLCNDWSLFAIDQKLAHRIGPFDENFFPVYYEDCDYNRRCRLAGVVPIEIEAGRRHDTSASHAALTPEQRSRYNQRFAQIRAYYIRKWGGDAGSERFEVPFDGSPPPGWSLRCVTRGDAWQSEPWL